MITKKHLSSLFVLFGVTIATLLIGSGNMQQTRANAETADETNNQAQAVITEYERDIVPLEIAAGRAWWQANVSGKDEDFEAKESSENQLNKMMSDAKRFERIKRLHENAPQDAMLARQIELLYLGTLEKQVPQALLERMTSKANAIEKTFNVYRAKVGDRSYTDSEVRGILKDSKDSAERKRVWEASKKVGSQVIDDLRELVRLRNETARELGFKDYHVMQLELNEQDQAEVLSLFDELDELTRKPFFAMKAQIDKALAESYGISVDKLRPWHYHDPFFQEPPGVYETDLDAVFADADIVAICRKFYTGIGLPIDDVIKRSDLFEKPGKSPHAFCIDINREGDVRVLANIVANEYWMSTMLHELGHAVYSSKNIPRELPYLLRSEAHILTTEGVAMMFERFSKSGDWLKTMGVPIQDLKQYNQAAARMRRNQLLIFSRWCQVMLRFEAALYKNPGQDLNRLWWDLVEKYQGITRPENRNAPDFASKIHVVSAPCYYHNYMMGELFACQVHHTIAREVLKSNDPSTAIYTKDPRVGKFMIERVFGPGITLPWNELTKHATGETLNAKAFAEEFGGER